VSPSSRPNVAGSEDIHNLLGYDRDGSTGHRPGSRARALSRPQISVVIVSWECSGELLACASSLAPLVAMPGHTIEVVVVDNASTAFPGDELQRRLPGVRILRNDANRGFGPAANQGVAAATGEIVLLLNPDTAAVGNPFPAILEAFGSSPPPVAVAPALVDLRADGALAQDEFQLRHFPTLGQACRELLLVDRLWPSNPWLRHHRYLGQDRTRPFEVEQPAAAALAVRRALFLEHGGFDEHFVPAWFEDVDLCLRLSRRGLIVFWPEARFAHVGGVASRRLGYDRFLPIYYRNACRFWRTHHGLATTIAFRAILVKGMLLRLALLPLPPGAAPSRLVAARAYLRTLGQALGAEIE
jgi:N-acetylglucosaminyl-diphospho-decaprenol L-rhamnosyltransferase